MKINAKLYALKKEVGAISKEETNPFFKSKYFDINGLIKHIEPLLDKHKLILLQPILGGAVISEIRDLESDECITSSLVLPPLDDPQKLGSCITYYRRYTLQSLLGLQAEDDDGNKASQPTTKQSAKTEDAGEWLNLFDKAGNKTDAFIAMEQAIEGGKTFTLQQVRSKYKVSNKTADELKTNFNIQ